MQVFKNFFAKSAAEKVHSFLLGQKYCLSKNIELRWNIGINRKKLDIETRPSAIMHIDLSNDPR